MTNRQLPSAGGMSGNASVRAMATDPTARATALPRMISGSLLLAVRIIAGSSASRTKAGYSRPAAP